MRAGDEAHIDIVGARYWRREIAVSARKARMLGDGCTLHVSDLSIGRLRIRYLRQLMHLTPI